MWRYYAQLPLHLKTCLNVKMLIKHNGRIRPNVVQYAFITLD